MPKDFKKIARDIGDKSAELIGEFGETASDNYPGSDSFSRTALSAFKSIALATCGTLGVGMACAAPQSGVVTTGALCGAAGVYYIANQLLIKGRIIQSLFLITGIGFGVGIIKDCGHHFPSNRKNAGAEMRQTSEEEPSRPVEISKIENKRPPRPC